MAVDVEADADLVVGPGLLHEVIGLLHDDSVLESLTDAVLAALEPDLVVPVDLEPSALDESILVKGPSHWQDVAPAWAEGKRLYPSVDQHGQR